MNEGGVEEDDIDVMVVDQLENCEKKSNLLFKSKHSFKFGSII